MAYSDGEALILTQVVACASFSATTAKRADWSILNKGRSRQYAVLRPGPFELAALGMGGSYVNRWTTFCEVWVRYKDYGSSLTTLEAKAAEIITRLHQYRLAADTTGTVQDVTVRRGGEPEEMWTANGGVAWLRQTLEIEWAEEASVTLQE